MIKFLSVNILFLLTGIIMIEKGILDWESWIILILLWSYVEYYLSEALYIQYKRPLRIILTITILDIIILFSFAYL